MTKAYHAPLFKPRNLCPFPELPPSTDSLSPLVTGPFADLQLSYEVSSTQGYLERQVGLASWQTCLVGRTALHVEWWKILHVSRWVASSFCLDVLECSLWMFMVEAMACQCWSFGRGFEPIWFSSIHSMLLNSIIGAILRYWRSMWRALMNQTLMVSNVFDSTARVSVGSVSCLFETHHQYS